MVGLVIVVIIVVIISIVSVKRDKNYTTKLRNNLSKSGFVVSNCIDVPDKYNECKPYCFLIDKVNQKWSFANYRALYALIYDYSDIIGYAVTIGEMGNDICAGERKLLDVEDYGYNHNHGILQALNINIDNCEYISVNVKYRGQAAGLQSDLLLFEKQYGFSDARHKDFISPSVSINKAKIFEEMLYEIVKVNHD